MIVLIVFSMQPRAGKTALALSLARRLQNAGRNVGYWKPVASADDGDLRFARDALRLDDAEVRTPIVHLAPGDMPDQAALRERLARDLRAAGRGKDVMLVEADHAALAAVGVAPADLATLLADDRANVRILCLARYCDSRLAAEVASAQDECGRLSGVLINAVAGPHRWFVEDRVRPEIQALGLPLLAILPQDAALGTTTVRDLANALRAEVLVAGATGALDELFESVMFGSMSAEDGRRYFSRKQNKLVVSRGDHPDVHLAALNTSTRCLLLAGGYPSYPFVLDKAEELGVPVLSVKSDVAATIDRLDGLLADSRAWTLPQIARFDRLVQENGGWAAVEALVDHDNL